MRSDRAPSLVLRWVGVVLIGVAGGAGAALALVELLAPAAGGAGGILRGTLPLAVLGANLSSAPVAAATVLGSPLAAVLLATLLVGTGRRNAAPQPHVRAEAARAATQADAVGRTAAGSDAALRLLALLQQEGRLVDFLEEDLAAYPDDQIGAAARAIHQGCRAVLRERLDLAPILLGGEGATVTVERGFDPAAVRVTGNVRGEPPYHGVLRHQGWRSTGLRLPEGGSRDASVLAPAEVEVL